MLDCKLKLPDIFNNVNTSRYRYIKFADIANRYFCADIRARRYVHYSPIDLSYFAPFVEHSLTGYVHPIGWTYVPFVFVRFIYRKLPLPARMISLLFFTTGKI